MTNLDLLHWPKLSRLDTGFVRSPGPGLGNLLFPISRALIGRETYGGALVYPTMRQAKIGTYLRREADKRTYGDVLRPRSASDWKRWWSRFGRPVVDERAFDGTQRRAVIAYSGMGRYFHDLQGHRGLIASWLRDNIRQPLDPAPIDIALHVRLGDFSVGSPSSGANNVRQPLGWYREAFEQAKSLLGSENPSAVLFTDSDAQAIADQLGIPGLKFDRSANALASIMQLSAAKVLVASRSTFSMWAAFLGGMPAIWDRNYGDRTKSMPHRPGLDHLF